MVMIDGIYIKIVPLATITRSAARKVFTHVLKGSKACMIMRLLVRDLLDAFSLIA